MRGHDVRVGKWLLRSGLAPCHRGGGFTGKLPEPHFMGLRRAAVLGLAFMPGIEARCRKKRQLLDTAEQQQGSTVGDKRDAATGDWPNADA